MTRFLLPTFLLVGTLGTVNMVSAQAPEVLAKQCQKGKAWGCYHLGNMYFAGEIIRGDKSKAHELYRKACNKNHAEACFLVGSIYLTGIQGRFAEKDKALNFFKKACTLENQDGCQAYLKMLHDREK